MDARESRMFDLLVLAHEDNKFNIQFLSCWGRLLTMVLGMLGREL